MIISDGGEASMKRLRWYQWQWRRLWTTPELLMRMLKTPYLRLVLHLWLCFLINLHNRQTDNRWSGSGESFLFSYVDYFANYNVTILMKSRYDLWMNEQAGANLSLFPTIHEIHRRLSHSHSDANRHFSINHNLVNYRCVKTSRNCYDLHFIYFSCMRNRSISHFKANYLCRRVKRELWIEI